MRASPLQSELEKLLPTWVALHDMPAPLRLASDATPPRSALRLTDLSSLPRVGVKGPRAADWLGMQGVIAPAKPNEWVRSAGDGVVARLGVSEFLIEDGFHTAAVEPLAGKLQAGIDGVYPVLRQDAALVLAGEAVNALLLETCSYDFASFAYAEQRVVMTSMVGVSVTIVRWLRDELPIYRVWCDASFGHYLWHTLLEVAHDLGGAAVGIEALFPEVANSSQRA